MTTKELEIEMRDIVEKLKKDKKQRLAQCIEQNWDKTAIAYSKELNSWAPAKPMEKELVLAFEKELHRLETADSLKNKILDSLQRRRVLQTAPHLVATEGTRMLCINWLGSLGVNTEDFYVVAMFSGIPFSNNFHPGRINRKDISINLFPSTMQDDLVYRSKIQNKLVESIKSLPEKINKFIPQTIAGESYTKWALKVCQNIERKILVKDNLVFLDINEVVSNYLVQVLKNKDHVLYKIFFDQETRGEFMKILPNEIMFYCSATDGKYENMENIIFDGNNLKSKNKNISLDNPHLLITELKNGRFCPALVVSFLALAFLNEFKCFGSFYQVEYLPEYQQKIANLKCMKEFEIEKIPTMNLTTGVFPKNETSYPVDIILDRTFELDPNILFGELLVPMKNNLFKARHQNNDKKQNK